ncbi:MAG TPA: GAF domain-containing protein, partial [Calditrichae bacterium]|nr:GAF domain-containing protein [Calditrichia bacterium]
MANTSTDVQQLQQALAQKEKEIYSIQRIGRALSSTLRLDELLKLIMQEITVLMDADRSTLFLVDKKRGEIWSKIALKAEVKEIRLPIGKGISGYVAQTGETINIPDAYNDPRFDPSTDKRTGYRTRSILCMPVWEPMSGGKEREIMGVIQVLNKREGHFTEEDEALLETLASQVAISIANARLYQQLEKKYRE